MASYNILNDMEYVEDSGGYKLSGWSEFPIEIENVKNKDMGIDSPYKSTVCIKLTEVDSFYRSNNDGDPRVAVSLKSGEQYFIIFDYEDFKKLLHEIYTP